MGARVASGGESIQKRGRGTFISPRSFFIRIADQVEHEYGKIDIVVADAAVQGWKSLLEMDDMDGRRASSNELRDRRDYTLVWSIEFNQTQFTRDSFQL